MIKASNRINPPYGVRKKDAFTKPLTPLRRRLSSTLARLKPQIIFYMEIPYGDVLDCLVQKRKGNPSDGFQLVLKH